MTRLTPSRACPASPPRGVAGGSRLPSPAPRRTGRVPAGAANGTGRGPAGLALALLLALALAAAPARAADQALSCFSIQAGAFANPDNARRYHARLLSLLPPAAADELRLERIGSLNVLRIGRAASREELDPLLDAVRPVVEAPRVMEVEFRPERFIIPPRRGDLTPTPAALPAPLAAAHAAAPARAGGYTVQVATYTEPDAAEKAHAELRRALPPEARAQLRLEANGDFYVLRLGRAASRDELAPLRDAARAAGEKPAVIAADFLPERFLIPPGATAQAEPAPAPAVEPPAIEAPRPASFTDPHKTRPPEARTPAEPALVKAPAAPAAPAPRPPAAPLPEAIATGYTVQLGSFASRANALATHQRLLAALPVDLADELRVERVGIYHVLRLGLAPTRAAMAPVLERVAAYSPMPVLLAADLDPDRLEVPPRSLGRAAAPEEAPAPMAETAPEPAPAQAPAEAAAAPPAATLDEPLPPLASFGATRREQDLIAARIATRTGDFPQGKKLYEKILAEHPGDEEVLEQYVDALVDAMEYDLAQLLLADWLKRDPENPRPRRLMGLMLVRAGEYERAYAPFMDLLEHDPGDIGVMADLGYAKLGGGNWQDALQLFSAVADEQPDNEAATQIVQEILMAHRPRLASDYVTEFRADDAVVATSGSTFSTPLSDRWALDLKYALTTVDRPSKDDTQEGIAHAVQDWMLTARALLHEHLTAFLGLGAVTGIGDRVTSQAGMEWRVHRPGRILALVERNRPWTDRVDATRYQGFQDHATLAYDALFHDRWALYLAAERFRYALLDHEYGRRNLGTGRLSRRLGWKPNLWLGYAYSFGSSEYDDFAPRAASGGVAVLPVALDKEEESHSWFLTMDERVGRNLRLLLSGGAGVNTMSGNAFYFSTGEFLVEVNNRLTLRTGLGYNSDKSSVGGETTTLTVGILWIF